MSCRGVSLGDLDEELFIAPLAVPKAPQRFYYKFGRPVQTSREDQNNPERVQQLYQEVQLNLPSRLQCLHLLCGKAASAESMGAIGRGGLCNCLRCTT